MWVMLNQGLVNTALNREQLFHIAHLIFHDLMIKETVLLKEN